MAEMKTKKTNASVEDFLNAIEDDEVREDCIKIAGMMEKATKSKPRMWGPSIIGFGDAKLKYPNGREIDWMVAAFSPRKQNITVYIDNFSGLDGLLAQLGKHSRSKACLYFKRLSEIHVPTLRKIINTSVARSKTV